MVDWWKNLTGPTRNWQVKFATNHYVYSTITSEILSPNIKFYRFLPGDNTQAYAKLNAYKNFYSCVCT